MAVLRGGDKAVKVLADIGTRAGQPVLKVGFFADSTQYPDGKTVAQVAFDNEFGIPQNHQPPRPFFRQTIDKESPSWGPKLAAAMKGTQNDGKAALELVGDDIKGALYSSIVNFTTPGNAPLTIMLKGFDAPLRDTMKMSRSIQSEVDE